MPASDALRLNADQPEATGEQPIGRYPGPRSAREEAQESLAEIAQRLAELDLPATAAVAAAPQAAEAGPAGQKLAATLDRVGELLDRLKAAKATQASAQTVPPPPVSAAPPAPVMQAPPVVATPGPPATPEPTPAGVTEARPTKPQLDAKHRREASAAFRERLATIRAEFDRKVVTRSEETRGRAKAEEPAPPAPVASEKIAEPAPAAAEAPAAPAAKAKAARPPAPGSDLQMALASIISRQRRLDTETPTETTLGAEMTAAPPPAPAPVAQAPAAAPVTASVEASPGLTTLADRIEALTQQVAAMRPERTEALMDGLQVGITEMRATIASLPKRHEALAADIGDVSGRVRALEEDHVGRAEAASLQAEIGRLSTQTASYERVEQLAGTVADLREASVDAAAIELLTGELEGLRAQIGSAANARHIELMAGQVEALAFQVEELLGSGGGAGTVELAARIEAAESAHGKLALEVRALAGSATTGESVSQLVAQMGRLSTRVEQLAATHDESMLEKVDLGRIDRLLTDISTRLAMPAGEPQDGRIGRLEIAIRDLADRIEIAGSPDAGPGAVAALEGQVARLAEQMTGMHHAATAAAERAADRLLSGHGGGDPQVAALTQHMQALSKAAVNSERRMQGTLDQVHETLDRVVARLAMVEEEIARAPAVAAPQPGAAFQAAAQRPRAPEPQADMPLEPGSGLPDYGLEDTPPARQGGAVEFIAAARRAVKSANSESRRDRDPYGLAEEPESGRLLRIGRRPVMLGVAAVVLMLGLVQLAVIGRGDANAPLVASTQTENTQRVAANTTTKPPAFDPTVPLNDNGPETTASISPGTQPDPVPTLGIAITELPKAAGSAMLRNLATGGDPSAEYEIGARLSEGRGVSANPQQGAAWFERAALDNFAPAQYRLASMYQSGQGVARDVNAARGWYQRAALRGHVRAMHNLAVLYADGSLGQQDYKQAATWFRRAAERGLADSQVNLAVLLSLGLGMPVDPAEAYKWYALAAAQGDAEAAAQRDAIEKKLDPTTLIVVKRAVNAFRPVPIDPAVNVVNVPAAWDSLASAQLPPR